VEKRDVWYQSVEGQQVGFRQRLMFGCIILLCGTAKLWFSAREPFFDDRVRIGCPMSFSGSERVMDPLLSWADRVTVDLLFARADSKLFKTRILW
jgi:hypothetical protein